MSYKWNLYDPEGDGTSYDLDINPASFTYSNSKSISNQATAAGGQIFFQGRNTPETINFGGVILDIDFYNVLLIWSNEKRQIRITDDLGRQGWYMITRFTTTRQRKSSHPVYMSYTMDITRLDWA